ncbi:MAG TPA: VCBS repeat-containing protein [Bryobacteraceae bacterium]|nr:VCBS repeat-containing protein [Bryobacteraceae bacterium]
MRVSRPRDCCALAAAAAGCALLAAAAGPATEFRWKHLSSAAGDLAAPNIGREQTSATVADFNKDGVNDFVITERTAPDSVVLYLHGGTGWNRAVIEPQPLHIEAGGVAVDVDGDGDLDFIAGGDWKSNQVWWWENPYPNFDCPWKRHLIKNSGAAKHHDQIAADFDGCGRPEIAFWNQDAHGLFIAKIPSDPRGVSEWPITQVYAYSADSEPVQRGAPASFRGTNEHEGLAVMDIDGDGRPDIVGGGRWYRNLGGLKFEANLIDPSYSFSRAAAGQLKQGGRPEVVFVVGDGDGPLNWYEWVKGTWIPHKIADIHYGHSLAVLDVNGDGNPDIFCAEQRLDGANPDSKIYIFYGDGAGNFTPSVIDHGYDLHEAKIADLNGDGLPDILGKPYNYQTPRLDIWINQGAK